MHVGLISFTDVDSGLDLANALVEAGATVTFYSSYLHVVQTIGDTHKPVERLYEKGLLHKEIKIQLIQLRRMRDLRMISVMKSLVRMIRNDEVDVVHILIGGGELWTAVLASLINDMPTVSTIIIPKPNIGEFPPPWVVTQINKLIIHASDMVIVNGKDHVSMMQEIYHYPVERVAYIPLGPRSVFLKWSTGSVSEETGTILFLGRIHKHKGLEYLIKAQPLIAKNFPLARIIIAGRGEDLERCKQLISEPGKFEILDGFIPGETVAELFQKASIVAVPYLTAATSGILVTAYVFGKPVVATRVGSLPEYVQEGVTGLLVEPRNEVELASALTHLLINNDLRHQMGQNAANWIEQELGWKNIAQQTLKTYARAIDLTKPNPKRVRSA